MQVMNAETSDDGGEAVRLMLKKHCASLMEHFDTVQIFITIHSRGETAGATYGEGNAYAREGFVREWITEKSLE